ncbi:hypothetical protein T4E_2851 [Trichinella pseudospiralis]|uniref:Uncharacterized protein n=1 Tax=Trichinella pseudospiralis TaxID=6337 RepID=A0A0V0XG90_TRIPS|nr:hypothetical protein T4E_2851 [Trichinella pseudospiralis]
MKKRMTRSRVEKKPNEGSSMGLYSAGLVSGYFVRVKLSHKGECEIFPCSLSRRSAEFWSLNGESLCRRGGETLLLWHPWKRGVLVLFCSFPKFRGGAVCCSFPHTAAVGEILRFWELCKRRNILVAVATSRPSHPAPLQTITVLLLALSTFSPWNLACLKLKFLPKMDHIRRSILGGFDTMIHKRCSPNLRRGCFIGKTHHRFMALQSMPHE